MPNDLSETDILLGHQGLAGRRQLLARLFMGHRERLKRLVELRLNERLKRRIDPSDVVQDVFIEASRRLPEYLEDPPMPLYSWLRRLTAQRLLDIHRYHLKARGRDARREVAIEGEAMPPASSAVMAERLAAPGPSPSETAAHREAKERVLAILEAMKEIDREILALRHFEDLSLAEAAGLLGVTEETASKRYFRALRRLRKSLEAPQERRGKRKP
jgi:RNA polymerase sigma-70 factor (ECF subfamily)